ncbi:HlyD family secretion protein [Rhodoblastus sp.]|uniref:HlyD family secretion protein n=1 Tax=Rhodoblastus sp. TaxID=1962975 RepID=UPI003F959825
MNESISRQDERAFEGSTPSGEDAARGSNLARFRPRSEASGKSIDKARGGPTVKRWLFGLALAGALTYAGAALARYIVVGQYIYTTDDAYVRNDLAIVSPKISGYIEEVGVTDNQHVKAGQMLARIDAGDYQLAVAAARQKGETQDATIARIKAQVASQNAVVAQAQAQLESARAEQSRAEADLTRIRALAAADFATRQRFEQAVADRAKSVAAVAGGEAALAGAKANLIVLQSQTEEAQRLRAEMATAQARAERDLGFAEIKAPFDGVIGNRVVERGQFTQPGARMMALAPDDRYYVEANFKETQLDRLAPGEKAKVTIDAYGGREFDGVVESIAPASGAQYSLLPPENATGNFTKITQRFPVRIKLASAAGDCLRAGLSVVVEVDTRANADR